MDTFCNVAQEIVNSVLWDLERLHNNENDKIESQQNRVERGLL
jgi:hypothetical protein